MALNGEVVVTPDVTGAFAQQVLEAFRSRPQDHFALALTGSDDARDCYTRLAADAGSHIDWWKVDVYWADERCVPHDHEHSNYRMAREALLDQVGAAHATHLMRCAEGPDPYQLRLGDLGGLDLVHLGLGPDGHTASLVPGDPVLEVRSDPVALTGLYQGYRRLTMTYPVLDAAGARVWWVESAAPGQAKAQAASALLAGDRSVPAGWVERAETTVVIDAGDG